MSDTKIAISPEEAAERVSWTRDGIFEEIAAGRLRSFKAGKRRLIRVAALMEWAERREMLAAAPVPPMRRIGSQAS